MNQLLVELLKNILNEAPKERKYKAVIINEPGKERVTAFSSQANLDAAIKAGTHREYNPQTDSGLADDGEKTTPTQQPVSPKAPKKQEPVARPETPTGVEKPTGQSIDQKTASREIYGENGDGKLLINSPDAQSVLDNGFIPGEGAPPGSAGSNFNENISDEAAIILSRYPDMDEETLTRVLFERVKNTNLAKQQSDPGIQGTQTYTPQSARAKISVPKDITDPLEQTIYRNCLVTARSGRKKYMRALRGVQVAQQTIGFKKIESVQAFGGAKGDLQRAKETVAKATRCFVADPELGIVEVPKDVLTDWIDQSGGGKNAADTVIMTVDVDGNLIYDGWSDKKTLGDIQANSTLNEEYSLMSDRLDVLVDSGGISETDESTARSIILASQGFSDEVEDRYADTAAQLSSFYLEEFDRPGSEKGQHVDLYIQIIHHPDPKVRSSLKLVPKWVSWKGKVDKATKKSTGGSKNDALIRQFHSEGVKRGLTDDALYWFVLGKLGEAKSLSADERKILERVSETVKLAHEVGPSGKGKKLTPAKEKILGPFRDAAAKKTDLERLDIKTELIRLRREVIEFQREQIKKLNGITVKNSHGDKVKLGDHLEARTVVDLLHLDKIDLPPEKTKENASEFFEQILVRSTQLMMEGIPVDPVTLRGCLGVETSREFEQNFELELDPDDPNTIFIYMIRSKQRVRVARKEYRSKQGATGKTGTTVVWEKDMKDCFDKKGAK